MKQWIRMVSALLSALMSMSLIACAHPLPLGEDMSGSGVDNMDEPMTSGSADAANSPKGAIDIAYPEVTAREGVKYGVSATVTKIKPTGLMLNYYRESDGESVGELFTGEWFALERCVDEKAYILNWEQVPLLSTTSSFDWRAQAYLIPAQNKTMLTLDWQSLYGALDPGAYRLVKILHERTSEGEVYGIYQYIPFRIPEEPFVGYGLTLADVPPEQMPYADPLVGGDFRMTAKEVTARGATLCFSRKCIGGYGYRLERYNGNSWEAVPYLPVGVADLAVPAVALILDEPRPLIWTRLYGELEPGAYRVSKNLNSWEFNADYFAYFEITE